MGIDLDAVREDLKQQLQVHVKRDAALQKHLTGQDGRLDEDASDRAAYTQGDEVLEKLDDSSREQIQALTAALKRLDEGSYGVCTKCGEDIPAGRLAALPAAALCVGCA